MSDATLEMIHIGVTVGLAIVGALVIQPMRDMRDQLADVASRLAYLEGRWRGRDDVTWPEIERRHQGGTFDQRCPPSERRK